MATIALNYYCDLNQAVKVQYIDGNVFSGDNAGNTISVFVMDGDQPATLGGSVSADVIRADGSTVAVSGALDGNRAYVILPQACYAVPGSISIVIKNTQNTTITTIAALVGNVYRSSTDTVVDPGSIIPSISSLIAAIDAAVGSIPADYSSLLATIAGTYSSSKTYNVGDYAWESGVLKRCIVPITAGETFTAAHWTNAVVCDDLSNLKSAINYIATYENSPNLFDTSGILEGKTLSIGAGKTINDVVDDTTQNVSPIIEAEASTAYVGNSAFYGNGTAKIYCYTSGGAYIGGVDAVVSDGKYSYTTLPTTKYIRFRYSPLSLNADTYMFVKGTTLPNAYIGYDEKILISGDLKTAIEKEEIDFDYTNGRINELNYRDYLFGVPNTIDHSHIYSGGYINGGVDGSVSEGASNLWYSDYTEILGGTTYYYGEIAPIYFAYYDSGKNYISGYGNDSQNNVPNPFTTPANAKYIRFTVVSGTSTKKNNTWINIINEAPEYTEYKYGFKDETIFLTASENPCDYNGNEITIFNKIMCIGDSITAGTFNHNEGGTMEYEVDAKYSYPTYLTKLCGVETLNNGLGGRTSVQWWSEKQSSDFSGYDCAIINLGINDALQNVSASDTTTAISSIISALRSANNNIKIFIATVVPAYSDGTTQFDAVNETIKDIATNNNCYLIDLSEYSHARKATVSEAGHLTAWGYYRLAKDYISAISYIMNENRTAFKFVQFIGTDYAYNA